MRSMVPFMVGAAALMLVPALTRAGPSQDPELGLVRWGRNFDAALADAKRSGKPVLVLFDEIPGCATCTGFGAQVLSYPLLVDAIENEFVPVVVHNNSLGADAAVLARYGEPAWNNPVVRFLDAAGHDIVPRRDGLYSEHEIAGRLVEALTAAGRPVPAYLTLALEESHLAGRQTATFGMSCFWEGEARLGALDGVVSTRAVMHNGSEAVEVAFDSKTLPHERLVKAASSAQCDVARHGATHRASTGDQHYYLSRSPLRFVPLTPTQAARVNAALHDGSDPLRWLSPRQLGLAAAVDGALKRDPCALAGLDRPDDIEALTAYERALRERLVVRARG